MRGFLPFLSRVTMLVRELHTSRFIRASCGMRSHLRRRHDDCSAEPQRPDAPFWLVAAGSRSSSIVFWYTGYRSKNFTTYNYIKTLIIKRQAVYANADAVCSRVFKGGTTNIQPSYFVIGSHNAIKNPTVATAHI
jgi:hypothetical protein